MQIKGDLEREKANGNTLRNQLNVETDKVSTIQTELDQEKANVATIKAELVKEKATLEDLKTEFQMEKTALIDHEISCHNSFESELKKIKTEYHKEKEKHAATISLSEKLQKQLDQECANISSMKGEYEQELNDINVTLKEKEKHLEELKVQSNSLKTEISKAKEEIEKAKDDESTRIATQKDQYWQEKLQEELQAQKKRYEAKVKSIHDTLTAKFKVKLEECIAKWKADVAEKDKKLAEYDKHCNVAKENAIKYEERYGVAKRKIEEVVTTLDEVTGECNKKDAEVKELKKSNILMEVQLAEIQGKPSVDTLSLENQHLQQEIKKLRNQSRSLQVQFDAANAKIRELQKPNGSSKSTSALPMIMVDNKVSKKGGHHVNDGFKMPTAKNTPGRTRASRTQSEVTMARRPPQGSGSLFTMNDEEGEMFSNSYLSDLKAGRCSTGDNGGRISELARRNTMQPAHLKSSYPAETQFRPAEEFTDDDLRIGAIQKLTDATSNLSVDR